jgi:hypothetical protein
MSHCYAKNEAHSDAVAMGSVSGVEFNTIVSTANPFALEPLALRPAEK